MTGLSRWTPFSTVETMQDRFSSIPDVAPVRGIESPECSEWMLPVDVIETDDEYIVRAALPGIAKESVHVTLEHGYLLIGAERQCGDLGEHARYLTKELICGRFSRAIELPSGADTAKVEAVFSDGLLTVHVPKAASAKARRIEVRSE